MEEAAARKDYAEAARLQEQVAEAEKAAWQLEQQAKELQQQMEDAAARKDYSEAARLQRELSAVEAALGGGSPSLAASRQPSEASPILSSGVPSWSSGADPNMSCV